MMIEEVMRCIKERRSIRKFDRARNVEEEKIQSCLEAARWAPSASNMQPWYFLIVRNKTTREKLTELHPYGKFMVDSPVVFVPLGDPGRHHKYWHSDTAVAIQNFLLAAHAQGLGTCWAGVTGSHFEKEMKEVLGIPDDLQIIAVVAVGYPTESPSKDRRPLVEIVSYEKYG
ncbi:MAG: nitroreductase family protein [Candidatus Heimdallarchaeota archaeon]